MITTKSDLPQTDWHSLSIGEVSQQLNSDLAAGLTTIEVDRRHTRFGANELVREVRSSVWTRLFEQFNQPLVYILLAAGVVTAVLQDWVDAGVIFGVTILNAIIGFVQESKAENALAALANAVDTEATAIREGKTIRIPSSQIVPGDIIVLAAGDKVPADLRLFEANNLRVDESGLTGESVPVGKDTHSIEPDTALADRANMAYMGSLVVAGQGRGLVVAIANATETGQISQMIERGIDTETPIVRKIAKFSKQLLYVILSLAAAIFVVGIARSESWLELFSATVAFAVAAIPEGLPAIVTITLSIGVARLARRNVIIRKLAAVETLGSTTVICSDKTGTLTENQMTVQVIYAGDRRYQVMGVGYEPDGKILHDDLPIELAAAPALVECLQCGVLCNDARLQERDGDWSIVGDPTEGALIVVAAKAGLSQSDLEVQLPRLAAIPFESQLQYMATLHRGDGENVIYLKGSIEVICQRCEMSSDERGKFQPFDSPEARLCQRARIERRAEDLAKQGLRVLAFAKKIVPAHQTSLDPTDLDRGLVFLGLQGTIDPPRAAAIEAVRACQSAGIQVKMITGDHPLTASAIASRMKLSRDDRAQTLTGQDLSRTSDRELARVAKSGIVFARVAPEQKLRLVRALQSQGEIVAMTGDGVNDAPALKQADLGIAMGITGTEVAKEAASMILTDDNFASIVAAVEEGRTVYQNLVKAIGFTLPVNGGEGLIIFVGVLFGTALPILPLQILWINMVSSVTLTVPLSFEPKSSDVMRLPPRRPNQPLLTAKLARRIAIISTFNLIAVFSTFLWAVRTTSNPAIARTMAVDTLVAAETFYLLSISQFLPSVVARLRGSKRPIAYAPALGVAAILLLQTLFSQWSVMNRLFATVPVTLIETAISIGVSLPMFIVVFILERFDPLD